MFLNIPSDNEDDLVFSTGFDGASTLDFSFSLFFTFSVDDSLLLTLLLFSPSMLSSSSSVMVSFKLLLPVAGTSLEAALSSLGAVVV